MANDIYIYVIAWGLIGPCKIGISKNPTKRLAELQPGCPYRLEIKFTEQLDDAHFHEQEVLKAFRADRMVGEWVNVSVSDAIHMIKTSIDVLHYDVDDWLPIVDGARKVICPKVDHP